jgi:hypothetical protein
VARILGRRVDGSLLFRSRPAKISPQRSCVKVASEYLCKPKTIPYRFSSVFN